MEDVEDDDEGPWSPPTYEPVDLARSNVVGGVRSVNEQNALPWSWGVSQRFMQQRCSLTGRWRDET